MLALVALTLSAATGHSQIRAAEPGTSGIRFLADGSILSVSARATTAGVAVTVMGQDAAEEFLDWLRDAEPGAFDSSGLVEGIAVVPSPDDGLPMLEIEVRTREPVDFSVSNEGTAVEIRLEPERLVEGAEPAPGIDEPDPDDPPRRVLTAADLEPLESELDDASSRDPGVRARTVGRVNLRPEPSLDARPLMTLPDRTVVRVLERGDDWWLVRLGELEGWVRGDLLQPAGAGESAAPPESTPESPGDWLGERGAWLDRLDQALGADEVPEWDGGDLRSGGEIALQDRAEREASRRRLAVAEQDLREARAESASLRIELARAGQEIDGLRTRAEDAEARAAELESLLEALRQEAVSSRSSVEGERLRVLEAERRAGVAEREQERLRSRVDDLEEELVTARVAGEMARVEADSLRLAAQQAMATTSEARERPIVVVEPEQDSGDPPILPTPFKAGGALVLWNGVETAVAGWTEAWSSQDPETYFAYYAQAFFDGREAEAWRALRRERLQEPEWIDVAVDDLELTLAAVPESDDPIRVRATFVQTYRSSSYQDVVRKELDWAWVGGAWRIVDERSVAVLLVGRG